MSADATHCFKPCKKIGWNGKSWLLDEKSGKLLASAVTAKKANGNCVGVFASETELRSTLDELERLGKAPFRAGDEWTVSEISADEAVQKPPKSKPVKERRMAFRLTRCNDPLSSGPATFDVEYLPKIEMADDVVSQGLLRVPDLDNGGAVQTDNHVYNFATPTCFVVIVSGLHLLPIPASIPDYIAAWPQGATAIIITQNPEAAQEYFPGLLAAVQEPATLKKEKKRKPAAPQTDANGKPKKQRKYHKKPMPKPDPVVAPTLAAAAEDEQQLPLTQPVDVSSP
jgi:hypothetical protein